MMSKTNTVANLREIHVIFKTHLDLGFTDYARNVERRYFDHFFPRAIELSRTLRQEGKDECLIWTVGSWLIYQYFEKERGTNKKLLERAIMDGDIAWHGLPFTTHSELMDASLFRHGLSISQHLDRRFGRKTLAAKMTDVPGHTRAIVPLLAEAGIQFLHIGVNPASTAPRVPSVFVWRHCDQSVIVMYHKGSYGDLMIPPGMDTGIYFAHALDNQGPPSRDEVMAVFQNLRRRFPAARVFASTLSEFARTLLPVKSHLPVVEHEIGDTWIHGVGSDPGKVRVFRELCRLRRAWLAEGKGIRFAQVLRKFGDRLLPVAEHTWGMDEKTHLGDYEYYDRRGLAALRRKAATRRFEASWDEQRKCLSDAMAALGASPLGREAKAAIKALTPIAPAALKFSRVATRSVIFKTDRFQIRFDRSTGAVDHLLDRETQRVWARPRHPLGLFRYELFSHLDYERFVRQYLKNLSRHRAWAIPDFTKPGMKKANGRYRCWGPVGVELYQSRTTPQEAFWVELSMPSEAVDQFGCPRRVTLEVQVNDQNAALAFRLQTFDKSACRLPEALWFSFCPAVRPTGTWQMTKMGELISPNEVVCDGNRRLHAVSEGVSYCDGKQGFFLETLDSPLVAFGHRSLLDFNNRQPSLRKGIHFNLYNNVWGTNFPMWYNEDCLFRFSLTFSRPT